MTELRKHYVMDNYCIIAINRAKRPHDFKNQRMHTDPKKCPFCPQNEHMLTGVVDEKKQGNSLLVKVVPNKFAALETDKYADIKTDNEFFTWAPGYGQAEVIIETSNHDLELEELPETHIMYIIQMYQRRVRAMYEQPHVQHVALFKNRGPKAGASLSHSHSQIMDYSIVPPMKRQELQRLVEYREQHGCCAYCKVMNIEKDSYRRVMETEGFIVFTPYASFFAMQVSIFPKRHIQNITQLTEHETMQLAQILKKLLIRLDELEYPDYNIMYHQMQEKDSDYHFYINISPRVATRAGFEFETGTIIIPVTPEDAAKFYRKEE